MNQITSVVWIMFFIFAAVAIAGGLAFFAYNRWRSSGRERGE